MIEVGEELPVPEPVRALVQAVREDQRESALRELLVVIVELCRGWEVEPPAWLAGVQPPEYPEHLALIDGVNATEVIRLALRRAASVDAQGLKGVARTIGVPVGRLDRIVSGVDLVSADTWGPLTELAKALGRQAPHPGVVGLGLLVVDLPEEHRSGAREMLTRALAQYLRIHGSQVPEWLEDELSRG